MMQRALNFVDARTLTMGGQGWPAAEPFTRLPDIAKGRVPESVWGLSRHSAGIHVDFQTHATALSLRWTLRSDSLDMPHMPATGVSGLDVYIDDPRRGWTFVANVRPSGLQNEGRVILPPLGGGKRKFRVYLPLYNGVSKLELSGNEGMPLEPISPHREENAIVVYGTSIAQGGCASRPGNAWPSMVGRDLGRSVINLGFSGAGRMETEVVELISSIKPAIFVVDCLRNMGSFSEAELKMRVARTAVLLSTAHPTTPLVFVDLDTDGGRDRYADRNTWQRDAILALPELRSRKLAFVNGEKLLGTDNEGTVDGVHPNDLGMRRQADAVSAVIKRLIRKQGQ
jgi:lysophospholipase L1-like esterase